MSDFEEQSEFEKKYRVLMVRPDRISVQTIRAVVESIERASGDDEVAHSAEDELRDRVLRAIASGHPNPTELAAAVLETGKIEFSRWYA